jgi:hypothetical protein
MNYRSSSWTGRAARDLESAFGPHTSRHIDEPTRPIPAHEIALYVVFVLASFLVAVLLILERT